LSLRMRNGRITTKRVPVGGLESIGPGAWWGGLGGFGRL
jgi:hypothetical protein